MMMSPRIRGLLYFMAFEGTGNGQVIAEFLSIVEGLFGEFQSCLVTFGDVLLGLLNGHLLL